MKLSNKVLRSHMLHWFRDNGWHYPEMGTPFTVPFLTNELGMDPESRNDTGRVYNIIRYMLKQAQKHYMKNKGYFDGENKYDNWDAFMVSLNNNDIYVFMSKREKKQVYYVQPSFQELESIDYDRVKRQLSGVVTVVDEMTERDEKLLSSGRPAGELLDASRKVNNVYLLNGQYKGKKVDLVDQRYHKCPFCKDRKFTSLAQLQRHMIYKHKMERKRHD